jgi:hypothetical protein
MCDVTVLRVVAVRVNVRIHFNVRMLYMASSCDIHNITCTYKSEIKYDSRETDDRYVLPKLRLGGTINPLFHVTQLTVYFTIGDTKHTQLCMNIQDEVQCDILSSDGPVIQNF